MLHFIAFLNRYWSRFSYVTHCTNSTSRMKDSCQKWQLLLIILDMFRQKNIVCGPPSVRIPDHLSVGKYLFEELSKVDGEIPALINGTTGEVITFGCLLQQSAHLANALYEMGIRSGTVVGMCSENRPEVAVADIAIIFTGATITNINMAYRQDEMQHTLCITKPTHMFCSLNSLKMHRETWTSLGFIQKYFVFDGMPDGLPGHDYTNLSEGDVDLSCFEPAEVNGTEDLAIINYSSGTTGLPKGVMITHLSLLAFCVTYYNFDSKPGNGEYRVLSVIPWFHAFGFCSTLSYLCSRRTVVCLHRFEPENYLSCIEKYGIHTLITVPTILVRLVKCPSIDEYNLSSVEEIFSGAAPLAMEVKQQLKSRMRDDVLIYQGYGLTESTLSLIRDYGMLDDTCNRTGRLLPGLKAKVVDTKTGKILGPNEKGELYFKGAVMMKGYLCKDGVAPEAFDEDNYLRTGDIGYYDEAGYFYVMDRVKDIIKYKGFQVPPAEVESILLQHKSILECAVVGKPDEVAGELPTAFIVLKPGAVVSKEEIASFVATRLSSPKWLRGGVNFVDSLPKNSTGKIIKSRIMTI